MLTNQINLELLQDKEKIDVLNFINSIANECNESKILLNNTQIVKCLYDVSKINGKFEDEYWVIEKPLIGSYNYFDFVQLRKIKYPNFTQSKSIKSTSLTYIDIMLLKCWLIEDVMELKLNNSNKYTVNVNKAKKYFSKLVDFINNSFNFSESWINNEKGSLLQDYYNAQSENSKLNSVNAVLSYIYYLEDKISDEKIAILNKYTIELKHILSNIKIDPVSRNLPQSKDILLFANYIEMFFYGPESKKYKTLVEYFEPVLMWWKITTVIPMRPSEFCVGLNRKALVKDNDKYYLKINRIKKKANIKHKLLPVLTRIRITKELYEYISNYIKRTDKYGKTDTLISYNATAQLRYQIEKEYPTFKKRWNHFNNDSKKNKNMFSLIVFSRMLESFYESIIKGIYNDTFIEERISPGDTRHIAFTSLMLQGFSPVEIAIMGGHRTLDSLDHYTCSTNTYIDTETIAIIRHDMPSHFVERDKIIKRIFTMPETCPIPLHKRINANIDGEEIGYCTANYQSDPFPCESEDCFNCSKWWCEPSEYEFRNLEKILKKRISEKEKRINKNVDFIRTILKNVGLSIIDGHLTFDNNTLEILKRVSLEIRSDSDEAIQIKSQITKKNKIFNELLNELDTLIPLESISEKINEFIENNSYIGK